MVKHIKAVTRNPLPQIVLTKEVFEDYPKVRQYVTNILNLVNSEKGGVKDKESIKMYLTLIKETLPITDYYRFLMYNILIHNSLKDKIIISPYIVGLLVDEKDNLINELGYGFILNSFPDVDKSEISKLKTMKIYDKFIKLENMENYNIVVVSDVVQKALDYYLINGKLDNTIVVIMINTILRELFEKEKDVPIVRYMALLEYATLTQYEREKVKNINVND